MAQPYIVVGAGDRLRLSEQVSENMNQGYVPHGSMVYNGQAQLSYMQPMILLTSQKVAPLNPPRGR